MNIKVIGMDTTLLFRGYKESTNEPGMARKILPPRKKERKKTYNKKNIIYTLGTPERERV